MHALVTRNWEISIIILIELSKYITQGLLLFKISQTKIRQVDKYKKKLYSSI